MEAIERVVRNIKREIEKSRRRELGIRRYEARAAAPYFDFIKNFCDNIIGVVNK